MQAVQLRDTTAGRLRKAAGAHAAAKRAALQGLSTEFHAKLPAVLDFPWTVATGDAPCFCSTKSHLHTCNSQPATQLHPERRPMTSVFASQSTPCRQQLEAQLRCRGGPAAQRNGCATGAGVTRGPRR